MKEKINIKNVWRDSHIISTKLMKKEKEENDNTQLTRQFKCKTIIANIIIPLLVGVESMRNNVSEE